jgi:hypothetical protein
MPMHGASGAPSYGTGSGTSFVGFINEFEDLAHAHGLMDAEKFDTIFCYVPRDTGNLWKSQNGYANKDWNTFCTTLEEFYLDLKANYTKKDLQGFVNRSAWTRMSSEQEVVMYYQNFKERSYRLRESRQLADDDCDALFFEGFHPADRDILIQRLFSLKPTHPLRNPHKLEDVYQVA